MKYKRRFLLKVSKEKRATLLNKEAWACWGELKRRWHLYKMQFTLTVIFWISLVVIEDICVFEKNAPFSLSSQLLCLILQWSHHPVLMASQFVPGGKKKNYYDVTNLSFWLHHRVRLEEKIHCKGLKSFRQKLRFSSL